MDVKFFQNGCSFGSDFCLRDMCQLVNYPFLAQGSEGEATIIEM